MFIPQEVNSSIINVRRANDLPPGVNYIGTNKYMATYSAEYLGAFDCPEAALSHRNEYIRHHAGISAMLITPMEHEMTQDERKLHKVPNKNVMCRIMGDDRSDEFLAKIEEQMKENNNE